MHGIVWGGITLISYANPLFQGHKIPRFQHKDSGNWKSSAKCVAEPYSPVSCLSNTTYADAAFAETHVARLLTGRTAHGSASTQELRSGLIARGSVLRGGGVKGVVAVYSDSAAPADATFNWTDPPHHFQPRGW